MARPRIEIELTTKGASAVQKVLGGVLSNVKSWVSGLGAVMGAALSVRELTRGIQDAVNTLDSAGAAAQKFGVGVKDLSTLGYAATISKANVEQLQTGLKFLNRSIYEAASGAQEYANAYDTLGVSVKNSDGSLRTSNEILLALTDRFAAMPNGAEKTALALQLLGRSGSEMIPFLNQGSEAIRQLQDEARVFGLEVTPQAAQAAGDFNDNLQRLQYAIQGMFQRIAVDLLPTLVALTDRIVALAKATQVLSVTAKALSAVLKEVGWFLMATVQVVNVLATAFDILTDYLSLPLFALERFGEVLSDLNQVVTANVREMLRQFAALGEVIGWVFAGKFREASETAKTVLKDLTVTSAKLTAEVAKSVARMSSVYEEFADYTLEVHLGAGKKWSDALDAAGANMLRFEWDVANPHPPVPSLEAPAFEPTEFDSAALMRQRAKLDLEAQAQALADRRLAITTEIVRLENDRSASDTERHRRSLDLKRQELVLVEEYARKLKERLDLEKDEQTRRLLAQELREAERDQASIGTDIAKRQSAGDPASIRDQLFNAADDMARKIGTLAQQIARSFTSIVGSAIDGVAESLSGLIQGTLDWADALRNVAQTMGTAVVDAISRMFAEWVVGRALMAMKNMLFSQQEGAVDAAAKAPGALMTSISSYGVAALVGTAALVAAVAAISGAFASGGLVHGPGGPKEDRVLARLSPGEYVIPAQRVNHFGVGFFERIRQGQDVVNAGIARAFAMGGLVEAFAVGGEGGTAEGGLATAFAAGGLVQALTSNDGATAPPRTAGQNLLARLAGGDIRLDPEVLREYGEPGLQAVATRLAPLTGETGLLGLAKGGSRGPSTASAPVDPSKLNLNLVLVDSRNQARQYLESAEGEARLVEILRKRRMQLGIPT